MSRAMNQATPASMFSGLEEDAAVRVAEYVCGLLDPSEHAQVHVLLSRDDRALAVALEWEEELLALVDALPPVPPSTALRETIQRTLGIGPPPAPTQTELLRRRSEDPSSLPAPTMPVSATQHPEEEPLTGFATANAPVSAAPVTDAPLTAEAPHFDGGTQRADGDTYLPTPPPEKPQGGNPDRERRLARKLWVWRLIGLSATAAAIVGLMLPAEPPPPPVQVIKVAPTRAAILLAPGTSSTPAWTATFDTDGNLMMQPLVHTEVPTGRQALLWTRSERVPDPRLLGSIDPNRPVQVPAAHIGVPAADQLLEITLETDEDAVKGVPHGPILYIGQMTTFGAEGAAPGPTASSAQSGAITTQPATE